MPSAACQARCAHDVQAVNSKCPATTGASNAFAVLVYAFTPWRWRTCQVSYARNVKASASALQRWHRHTCAVLCCVHASPHTAEAHIAERAALCRAVRCGYRLTPRRTCASWLRRCCTRPSRWRTRSSAASLQRSRCAQRGRAAPQTHQLGRRVLKRL